MVGLDFVDTSVLIRGIRALRKQDREDDELDTRAIGYIKALKESEGGFPKAAIPAIVMAEVMAGLETKEQVMAAQEVFRHLFVVPFDAAAAAEYRELRAAANGERNTSGVPRPCANADAMIAATAIAHGGARIVTCNLEDFKFAQGSIKVIEPPTVSEQVTLFP